MSSTNGSAKQDTSDKKLQFFLEHHSTLDNFLNKDKKKWKARPFSETTIFSEQYKRLHAIRFAPSVLNKIRSPFEFGSHGYHGEETDKSE